MNGVIEILNIINPMMFGICTILWLVIWFMCIRMHNKLIRRVKLLEIFAITGDYFLPKDSESSKIKEKISNVD